MRRYNMIRYNMIWYDRIRRYNMIQYSRIRYGTSIQYDTIQKDTTQYDTILFSCQLFWDFKSLFFIDNKYCIYILLSSLLLIPLIVLIFIIIRLMVVWTRMVLSQSTYPSGRLHAVYRGSAEETHNGHFRREHSFYGSCCCCTFYSECSCR
jgi:hypothetical protein